MTDLPATMTAIAISGPGGPEVLKAEQRPLPLPSEGEVLVKVAAAGVNRPDVLQRLGLYPPPEGAPDIPGLEIAGTVAMTGRNAMRWQVGDKVVALVPGGGYAEFCTVHETNALALPEPLSFAEAACVPETVFTVWHNLFQRGGLSAGETALVHGGTSGIGTTAIQLAKALGAKVIVTAVPPGRRRVHPRRQPECQLRVGDDATGRWQLREALPREVPGLRCGHA